MVGTSINKIGGQGTKALIYSNVNVYLLNNDFVTVIRVFKVMGIYLTTEDTKIYTKHTDRGSY